ncbi:NADPH-dependent FMN reductase [Streptomyces sp. NRRL S-87]|uniref:NADPH-dependent FMN reductase n=1 Tax=Streptomyces sp. NRRL S-87 TaxID=1463920 RepID=UPI0004BEF10B|nr:NADPH-dependent FMN reductase [Streptomyces sp. NRRL S-87]
MPQLLALSASPSTTSRTALVADLVVDRLHLGGFAASHLAVRDLPAADLLAARADADGIREAVSAVAEADGIIVATPVYKASYSGLLKVFLDLLPQDGLAGKTVLPLVTGGSLAHVLAIDYALRPVLTALGASHVTAGRFLLDSHVERLPHGGRLHPGAAEGLAQAVDEFVDALPARPLLSAAAPL